MYSIQAKPRINSKKFSKTIAEFKNEQEVIKYLKDNGLTITGKPYIFTHLPLNNNMIITCYVEMAHNQKIICSPEKLYNLIKNAE